MYLLGDNVESIIDKVKASPEEIHLALTKTYLVKEENMNNEYSIDYKGEIRKKETELITLALNMAAKNQSMAARILGISRTTLITKMKEYNLGG